MSETKMIHVDLTIAQRMIKERRALVPGSNKSDLSGAGGNFGMQRIQNELQESLAQCAVAVVLISALQAVE